MTMECFYTASVMIVSEGKVLLHLHPKFHLWLQVGGHIQLNELPHEAALREAKEETGIDISFYQTDVLQLSSRLHTVVRPMHLSVIDVGNNQQLLDFLYYAATTRCAPVLDCSTLFHWFSPQELESTVSLNADVRYFAREAIQLLSS